MKPLLTTVYAPSSRERAKKLFDKWRRNGRLRNEELQIITKRRKEIDVLLNVYTIYDEWRKLFHGISTWLTIIKRR